jgi:hypothetical protein
MNRKEVNEIKKIFNPANCCISRICSCYVDAEKNKRTELKEAFLSLPEEETFKYFTFFKSAMSGSIGKSLINIDFPLQAEVEGGDSKLFIEATRQSVKG